MKTNAALKNEKITVDVKLLIQKLILSKQLRENLNNRDMIEWLKQEFPELPSSSWIFEYLEYESQVS